MRRTLLALVALLALALPARAGVSVDPGNGALVNGAVVGETLGANVIADSTLDGACGDANWTCSGAWAISGGVSTRTASASNLALASKTVIDEGASGTWYRWDITTNLTAGTLTPSFCGQTLTAISTTGALTTTYRIFCPYQAAALGVPTLTAVAATEGTVSAMPLYPIASEVTGTGLSFKSQGSGMHFALGGTSADFWQGADALGLRVFGYDDQSAAWIKMYLASTGYGNIQTSSNMQFTTGSGGAMVFACSGVGDFLFAVDADTSVYVGDGTYAFGHAPYFGVEGVAEFDSKVWMDGGAHITGAVTVSGTAPGLSSCGTSPTITSGSTDHAGVFVIGATGTGCTLTFVADQGADTACVVGGAAAATWASTDTALVVTAVPGEYSYVCYGL